MYERKVFPLFGNLFVSLNLWLENNITTKDVVKTYTDGKPNENQNKFLKVDFNQLKNDERKVLEICHYLILYFNKLALCFLHLLWEFYKKILL